MVLSRDFGQIRFDSWFNRAIRDRRRSPSETFSTIVRGRLPIREAMLALGFKLMDIKGLKRLRTVALRNRYLADQVYSDGAVPPRGSCIYWGWSVNCLIEEDSEEHSLVRRDRGLALDACFFWTMVFNCAEGLIKASNSYAHRVRTFFRSLRIIEVRSQAVHLSFFSDAIAYKDALMAEGEALLKDHRELVYFSSFISYNWPKEDLRAVPLAKLKHEAEEIRTNIWDLIWFAPTRGVGVLSPEETADRTRAFPFFKALEELCQKYPRRFIEPLREEEDEEENNENNE